jgi:hypothetical protein
MQPQLLCRSGRDRKATEQFMLARRVQCASMIPAKERNCQAIEEPGAWKKMVEPRGFEPLTSGMFLRRASHLPPRRSRESVNLIS